MDTFDKDSDEFNEFMWDSSFLDSKEAIEIGSIVHITHNESVIGIVSGLSDEALQDLFF